MKAVWMLTTCALLGERWGAWAALGVVALDLLGSYLAGMLAAHRAQCSRSR